MKIKNSIIYLVILFGVLLQSQVVSASEPYINGAQAQIYDIKNQKYYNPHQDISDIQKGQKVHIILTFDSTVDKDIIVKIPVLKSFSQMTIISWNDKNQAIPKNTETTIELTTQLLQQKNILVMEAIYQGAPKGKVHIQASIECLDGLSYTKGFEFMTSQECLSIEDDTKIEAKFIEPHGKLISLQTLKRGESASLPQYQPIGYTVKGYLEEGKDTYYQGEKLERSTNFKAVIEPISYTIRYYIDDKVYHSTEAYYGTKVEYIEAPQKEGYQFVKWIGLINNIYKDLDVYALYQDDKGTYVLEDKEVKEEEFITVLKRKQTEKIKKSGDKRNDSQDALFELDQKQVFQVQDQSSFLESSMSPIFHHIPKIIAILIFIISILYIIIKKLNKIKPSGSRL